MRILEEFLGSFWSFVWAAKNCTSVVAGFARIAFSSVRSLAYFATSRLRFSFRWIAEVLSMAASWSGGGCGLGFSATERHSEEAEQVPSLVVGPGGGDERDVEPHALLHVVDSDLRKDGEVGDTQVVVALAVELRGPPSEVADGGQGDRKEPVEELPHRVAPQRDVAADDLVLLQLEVRDGLAALAQNRLLAGYQAQVALGVGYLVLVGLGVDPRVEADLNQLRDLVLVLVAAQLH